MFFEDLKTEKSSPKTLCEKNQNTKGKNVYKKKLSPFWEGTVHCERKYNQMLSKVISR